MLKYLLLLSLLVLSNYTFVDFIKGDYAKVLVKYDYEDWKYIKLKLKDIPCKIKVGDELYVTEDKKGNRTIECIPYEEDGC
tara:strand:- start:371 stop:613 length:243 start_codon:yes stop_codon:yes gene_type:complete